MSVFGIRWLGACDMGYMSMHDDSVKSCFGHMEERTEAIISAVGTEEEVVR